VGYKKAKSTECNIGLAPNVRFIRDVGYVFLDDGRYIFRMREDTFDRMRLSAEQGECFPQINQYPNLFIRYSDPTQVTDSFITQELQNVACWHRLSTIR
jgi:hypothetical protein